MTNAVFGVSGRASRIARRFSHRAGGAEGATWLIDYDRSSESDDEAGYRLGSHVLADREYVSIKDPDGHVHTFRVTNVEPV